MWNFMVPWRLVIAKSWLFPSNICQHCWLQVKGQYSVMPEWRKFWLDTQMTFWPGLQKLLTYFIAGPLCCELNKSDLVGFILMQLSLSQQKLAALKWHETTWNLKPFKGRFQKVILHLYSSSPTVLHQESGESLPKVLYCSIKVGCCFELWLAMVSKILFKCSWVLYCMLQVKTLKLLTDLTAQP